MKVTYYGHSAVAIEAAGKHILIDPFLTGNPVATVSASDVQADAILVTHGHGDHVGDTVAIAKRTGAQVVSTYELATWLGKQGVNVHPMGQGGAHEFDFGRVKWTMAFHGGAIETPEGMIYGGPPSGVLLRAEGKTIYHAGDTALFGDMKMIGDLSTIDLAILPIGDNFTMGPEDARLAAQWLKAKQVLPVHYNTFPLLAQDGEAFVASLKPFGIGGQALKPGQSMEV
ncbi:MAG: metal-dependent hydrolase [Firmicutes bacterium]|nr:metal-dependent hydrolase [Bacillota bacterium]